MKKAILFFLIFLLPATAVFCQTDFEKAMQEFSKMTYDPKSIYGQNKAVGKYYNIRGFKMYAEIYGQGKPILFIHGNGGSSANFFKQVPYFAKKYKVIIADSRAQGKSVDTGDSLSYDMMADDYAALLDVLKINSAYVVGWSDGGIDGLLLAIRHPGKVKKLAVTGANLRPDTTAVPKELWDMLIPTYNELNSKTNKNAEEKTAYKLVRLLVKQEPIPVTDLHKISCPVLVIGGDHDLIWPGHTLEIFHNIPDAYLWILPNSGHATPVIYSADFNKNVNDFFTKPFKRFDVGKRFL
ncbi:MAG: alpha/beta hydrolase [Ferruginibacter sp.]